ncbi:MAG TPA: hypothetical protein PKJ77_03175 [Thermodesulfobacteriota bacterium]|nr:hypothetical protein [Thermodesulfobacteriota bacterium]
MPKHSSISLVMATKLEALPLLELLGLQHTATRPFPLYCQEDLILIISGIGKTNAAVAVTYSILSHQPGLVVNLGAAGATHPGCTLGDVYHGCQVIEYDRPHLRTEALREMVPLVLPGFPGAVIATQDKPVLDQEDRRTLGQCADLVDMEAAGVVQACERFSVPCSIFKFVSDTPDHTGHDEVVEHIKCHRNSFCEFFVHAVLPALRKYVLAEK